MMTQGIVHFGIVGRLFLLVISSLCWAGLGLSAQPAQLDFRHYTTNDGLPSSEVYTTFQDQKGFIWIGTDNGVARFDGYEFVVFDEGEGLEDMVVFIFHEDARGRLWVSTYSGMVFYFENGRFHPYAYNEITTELKKTNYIVKLLDVTEAGNMIFQIEGNSIICITPAGEVRSLTETLHGGDTIYVYRRELTELSKRIGGVNAHCTLASLTASDEGTKLLVLRGDSSCITAPLHTTPDFKNDGTLYGGVLERSGQAEVVISNKKQISITVLETGENYQYLAPYSSVLNYAVPGKKEKEYWLFFNRGHGVKRYDFSQSNTEPSITTFLEGHSVSSGSFDQNGGFWITTLDDGIYYCPHPEQELYLKDDKTLNAKSISLVLTGPGSFYAGYDDGSIFRYDKESKRLWDIQKPSIKSSERLFDMFYDSIYNRVYTPYYSFKHPLTRGRKLNRSMINRYELGHEDLNNVTNFNYFSERYPNTLFGTRGRTFAEIPLSGGPSTFNGFKFGLNFTGGHVLAADAQGRRLFGTLHGLYEITSDGRMVPENLGVEELNGRVVFIKPVNKHGLLFGTRGNGLIYYDQDTSYLVRESNGLASDMIRDIHKSGNGAFWISTLNGLSRISFTSDGGKYELRTFRTENGLPSNEVNQAETWKDEIWLATSAGMARFVPLPVDSFSPPPTVREVLVNGEKMESLTRYELPAGRQGVTIRFGTINYLFGHGIRYRYRIAEDVPWQYSFDLTANYPDLASGNYQFAVQSLNQDGFWSKSTLLSIYIATPWYATWWAVAGAVLLLVSGLTTYFMIRERRRKREQDLLLQINELEHAALHAQMNPHFVFNALNSIQNFVLQNDAKQAATYLSRFAQIIRQTLRSSVEGKHTLKEELDVLRTYLLLEKLRFKDGFSYELTVSSELSIDSISLPPLLIQPFVENAILHGLKGRKGGGWISIDFAGSTEELVVRVEDNGKGFDPALAIKKESLGMDITRRRLAMMNRGLVENSGMSIEPLVDAQGHVCGTRITLNIKLENSAKTPTAPSSP